MALAQNASGVSNKEIVIGSISDLSGPAANNGKHVRYGMMLRVEDSGYDPKKAVLAA